MSQLHCLTIMCLLEIRPCILLGASNSTVNLLEHGSLSNPVSHSKSQLDNPFVNSHQVWPLSFASSSK